jgi:hypothetical protein
MLLTFTGWIPYFSADVVHFVNFTMLLNMSLYHIKLFREDMDPDPLRILMDPDPEGHQLRILPGQEHCFISLRLPRFLRTSFFSLLLLAAHYIS